MPSWQRGGVTGSADLRDFHCRNRIDRDATLATHSSYASYDDVAWRPAARSDDLLFQRRSCHAVAVRSCGGAAWNLHVGAEVGELLLQRLHLLCVADLEPHLALPHRRRHRALHLRCCRIIRLISPSRWIEPRAPIVGLPPGCSRCFVALPRPQGAFRDWSRECALP